MYSFFFNTFKTILVRVLGSIVYFILFYFTILYWFCHTSTWICHGCTHIMVCSLIAFWSSWYWLVGVFSIYFMHKGCFCNEMQRINFILHVRNIIDSGRRYETLESDMKNSLLCMEVAIARFSAYFVPVHWAPILTWRQGQGQMTLHMNPIVIQVKTSKFSALHLL